MFETTTPNQLFEPNQFFEPSPVFEPNPTGGGLVTIDNQSGDYGGFVFNGSSSSFIRQTLEAASNIIFNDNQNDFQELSSLSQLQHNSIVHAPSSWLMQKLNEPIGTTARTTWKAPEETFTENIDFRSDCNLIGMENRHFTNDEEQLFLNLLPASITSSMHDIGVSTASSPSSYSSSMYTSHQAGRWQQRYDDLFSFKQEYGHCCVPSYWPQNAPLAQWVKRQRSQYKLKKEGRHSNMTDDREAALEALGFIWDSHAALWEERLSELRAYRELHGHCNIPTKCKENPQLAIWAKCQRRQFKLFSQGDPRSNINLERIAKLVRVGFVFSPRGG